MNDRYRLARSDDLRDERFLPPALAIISECYNCGAFSQASCRTLRQFGRKLSARTSVNWVTAPALLCDLLRVLNEQYASCIVTACIVADNKMPMALFFQIAIGRCLISKAAGSYEKIACWVEQYDLAQEKCRAGIWSHRPDGHSGRDNYGAENCVVLPG